MTVELTMLGYAALLAVVQLFLVVLPATVQLGLPYLAGPRDEGRALSGQGARLLRAFQNMMETLPLFAIAVLVAHISGQTNGTTALAAQVYVVARLVYVPVYFFGIPWLRTGVWAIAFLSIIIILLQVLF